MKTLKWMLGLAGRAALIMVSIVAVLFAIYFLPWEIEWDFWAAATAIGTVGATLVALGLAGRALSSEKTSPARLVSAWVTDQPVPEVDGDAYERKAHLHVANESNEPVFNAMVSVHIGRASTPLGPLSAPSPISVVPPRREQIYDISVPLLAHPESWNPKASLTFSDPKGKRWLRDPEGALLNVSRKKQRWSEDADEDDELQYGEMGTPFNPLGVVLAFIGGLRDLDTENEGLRFLIDPLAVGWSDVDLDELCSDLESFQPTSMVDYQAPRIARVKLSGNPALEGKRIVGEGMHIELQHVKFVTLTLHPQKGWRIFQIGEPVPSDRIFFGGTLKETLEPYGQDPVESDSGEEG